MIFKIFLNILSETVEYQDFLKHGPSVINLVVLVAIISGLIQAWGMLKQNRKIWKNKSGAALPLTFFVFQFFYYLAYLIYGYKIRSGALMINNLVCILFIPIIVGIIKYKLQSNLSLKHDLRISPFLILVIPCVVLIKTQWSLIATLFIAAVVYAHLVFEISKQGALNHLEPRFIVSIILGAGIWLWYGIGIFDLGLIVSSGSTVLGGSLFMLFYLIKKWRVK